MADVDPAIQAAQEAFDTAYGEAFDRAMGERGTSVLLTPIEAIVAAIRPIVERECYTRAAEAIDVLEGYAGGVLINRVRVAALVRGLVGDETG